MSSTYKAPSNWVLPPHSHVERVDDLPLKVKRGHRPEHLVHDIVRLTLRPDAQMPLGSFCCAGAAGLWFLRVLQCRCEVAVCNGHNVTNTPYISARAKTQCKLPLMFFSGCCCFSMPNPLSRDGDPVAMKKSFTCSCSSAANIAKCHVSSPSHI